MKKFFVINGKERELEFEEDALLLDLLRSSGYTEVHCGCKEGSCGCCTILLDEVPVNSCQILAATVNNKKITTVSGLGTIHSPHPIQDAFVEAGAVQCGFCTPGMVLATYALLKKNPSPSDEEIINALDGNYCRCTGYIKILKAVHLAAKKVKNNV
ncbi:(2Fe-2S)-binding protein [Aminobacterium sp. MB27-C1]|uniref:(2Fe-2S)-binding protein n=1 Tax=Aminobacterium sp. MB27-C1 TaxID=3070661 RepID=UPI0027DAB979|nr:(2Fe-2S)-binding protein [Aminobacterium sp. MB27-C1]WMI72556.1 (2Fe-2S)-binding protein [Aminobacterium sp. MB27-C1]